MFFLREFDCLTCANLNTQLELMSLFIIMHELLIENEFYVHVIILDSELVSCPPKKKKLRQFHE